MTVLIVFLTTWGMMNATSVQQGESISGIAPIIHLERREK